MSEYEFDLFVIGAGSGGVRAARIAAGHGVNVAIADADRIGGTCVIRGCVPKKLMVLAGRFADDFNDAKGFGWHVGEPQHSWPELIEAKDREVSRLEALYITSLENALVQLIRGRAEIIDEHTVSVGEAGRIVTAAHILIATGSQAVKDDAVPGIEHAITSNEMFELRSLPKRLAVVGGGYIAVEFAGLMCSLGSKITLIHRGDHVLRGFDDQLRTGLEASYIQRGIDLKIDTRVETIEAGASGKNVTFTDGSSQTFDVVMYATGRKPNTTGLGLDRVGVLLHNGAIAVDEYSATNVPSIHAIGDVTDRANLTPVAIREGHALADSLFGNRRTAVMHANIPTAVFSTPEIGSVGLTEAEARAAGLDISVFSVEFRPLKATLSGREERSLIKLIVGNADDRVLGVHVLGDNAGEIIQMAGIAITCGATKAQFDATIAVHPTSAEELVTMRQRTR